ncbi:hypothetical protein [Vulcanisaeta sp. JCM 14467]|uniref:hypothetical protein n=1 Tax=Vulcanisaeta sp. JCM 14467 TaxID=1295370 RepID=UPI0006D2954D|nr:hypothetical protein [Vulcanisaeta sp. JCM 14467]
MIIKIVNELRSGNYVETRRLQDFIIRVRSVLKAGSLSGDYGYAMSLVGVDIDKPRPPYEDPDERRRNS